MMCSSAKLSAEYSNTLESGQTEGQTHVKTEPITDLEEMVTDHPGTVKNIR